jgi:Spy/CpxP family protein refolding chaperone
MLLLALVSMAGVIPANAAVPKRPATPAPAAPHDVRVTVTDEDDDAMLADDEVDGEDGGMFAGGPGAGGRHVMMRRVRRGPGGDGGGMRRGMRGHMGMGPGGPGGHFAMMLRHLDLTDAQKAKMRDIHDRQRRRDIQARADLEIGQLDLRKLVSADRPEAAAINTQIDKLARMRAERAKARVATMLEARALLTPQQLETMRKQRDGMGPGAGMGPGGIRGPGGMRWSGDGNGPARRMRVQVDRDTIGGDSQ